ncbi:MAG: hypothetical protein ACYC4K_02770 [Thiobacillus sp.]
MNNLIFMRETRNILISGHRPDRLKRSDNIEASLESVCRCLVFSCGESIPTKWRVLTGNAEGTDVLAAKIANELSLETHLIAPYKVALPPDIKYTNELFATNFTSNDSLWIDAADKTKLALADILIVVWDGEPPSGYYGGTVRILIEALLRTTPVIWICADEQHAGDVRIANLQNLTPSLRELLEANSNSIKDVKEKIFFSAAQQMAADYATVCACLKQQLTPILNAIWNTTELTDKNNPKAILTSLKKFDLFETRTLKGWWHSALFSLISQNAWKYRKYKAEKAWRGNDDFVNSSQFTEQTWALFDRFDRAATYTANAYRDNIVITHLLSSLAVLGAVAGAINWMSLGDIGWGSIELMTLSLIAIIVYKDHHQPMTNQQAWLKFRQVAEALRVSAILQPNFADLPALHRHVWKVNIKEIPISKPTIFALFRRHVCMIKLNSPAVEENKGNTKIILDKPYNWLVIQILREQGPIIGKKIFSENESIQIRRTQLCSLLDDQIKYHKSTSEKYEEAERKLHLVTQWVFYTVLFVVIIHLSALGVLELKQYLTLPEVLVHAAEWLHHEQWILLITAFWPALAAALHGINGMFEMERSTNNSKLIQGKLEIVKDALAAQVIEEEIYSIQGQRTLRSLAIRAADLMYREHDAWSELMKTQGINIPA